ncbi:MAG: hypothetical protein EBS98_10760 [Chitinophagia bacterium]|jgi:hypothetical protein|nr:hypothetical protein [Chitinophagia bacterium]
MPKPTMKAVKKGRKPIADQDKKVQVTFYVQYAKLRKFGCELSNNRATNTENLINFLNAKIDEQ